MDRLLTSPEEIQALIEASLLKVLGSLPETEKIELPGKLISEKELCEFLDVSAPTLIRWRQKGKVPFVRVGTCIRYNLHSVLKKLERGK